LIYGSKFVALTKIQRLDELAKLNTLEAKVESIQLAYSLSPLGKDHLISLKEKLAFVVGESSTNVANFNFPENTAPLSLSFILGFFLGDGNLYIRIRDNETGLAFVPKFEIKQKFTESNRYIMDLICKFLQSKGVQANLRLDTQYVLCVVEGIDNVCNSLLPLLDTYKEFFF